MKVRLGNAFALMIIFSAITLACNLATPQPTQPPPSDNEPMATAPPAEVDIPTDTAPEAVPSAGRVEITELNPCDLVTKGNVEIVLGQSVDEPILASATSVASCTYIAVPGEKFATVAVYEGEHAKNYLLNEISQLQASCELSMSTGEQPTTFLPEVEALRSQSILMLLQQDLALRDDCWKAQGFSYEQVTDLGENVYSYTSFLQGAVIGVATDDAYITFLMADVNATPEQALEAAKKLVQLATSP